MSSHRYSYIIAIEYPFPAMQMKEFLDIALVSASYEMPVALHLSADVVQALVDDSYQPCVQLLSMLSDFDIEIFTDGTAPLEGFTIKNSSLSSLQKQSKHTLLFSI